MKKNKVWIGVNSFFAFVSAYIFVKALVAISRFIVIRYFGGATEMDNFELDCITWMYSEFWTHTTVISIYLIGALIAGISAIAAYVLYRSVRMQKGFLKLWFSWIYVIAINQSIGVLLRDIPFKRDIYHALNWMYFPYWLMIVITVFSIPALYFTNLGNDIKFLRMAPSFDDIASNRSRRRFFTRVAMLPAFFGCLFVLLMHFWDIRLFEITEALVLLVSLSVTYFLFHKEELIVEFRIVKSEPSDRFNLFVVLLFALSVGCFYYFTTTYY